MSTKNYEEGFDRIFGKDHKPKGGNKRLKAKPPPCYTPGRNAVKGDYRAYQEGLESVFGERTKKKSKSKGNPNE